MNLRFWSNKIHLWLGLAVAVPLILLGLSGAVLTVRWSLDRALNPSLYDVSAGEESVDWDRLVSLARDSSGAATVTLLRNSPAGAGAVIAQTDDERMIHLDPHAERVIGIRDFGDLRSVVWWIQKFHTSFFLGRWGPTVVSSVTLLSTVGLLTGMILWLLPLGKSWVSRLVFRDTGNLKRLNWDLHNLIGFYTIPLVLLVFLTGVAIGFWPALRPYVYGMTGTEPTGFRVESVEVPDGSDFSLNRTVRRAESVWSDYELRRVGVPERADRPVRMRFATPDDPYEPGLSWIWVNPYTGEVLKEHHPPDRTLGDSIYLWLFPLHFGGWGHVWGETAQAMTRFVWALASLVPVVLSVTGFLVWYLK